MQLTFFLGVFVGLAVGISAARFLIWPSRNEPDEGFYEPPILPAIADHRITRLTNRNRSIEI